ncbi:MAG: hypothetical protein E2P05_00590 [Acidobacteria bacterium]|nr:MAG: hypothetical protein E2P05_00590 [Acidobacteriota bacterium]
MGTDNYRAKYQRYISSDEWADRRWEVLEEAQYTCEICGHSAEDVDLGTSPPELQVHHLTYERFGHERDEDLECLCKGCHDYLHAIEKARRKRADFHQNDLPVFEKLFDRWSFERSLR